MGVLIRQGNLDALVKVVVLCSGMEKVVMVVMMKKESLVVVGRRQNHLPLPSQKTRQSLS